MRLHKTLILASRSPRRQRLLEQVGLMAAVQPCDMDEIFDPALSAAENATVLALAKAECVARSVEDGIILGADTIVVLDGRMLGKPASAAEAVAMLQTLSGKTHTVATGIALVDRPSNRHMTAVELTEVTFRHLPLGEIEEYVAGGSPLDKAGAYGIQDDYGAVFVTRIVGCYYNVVGLPLSRLHRMLGEFQDSMS
jgi:septum formation protein